MSNEKINGLLAEKSMIEMVLADAETSEQHVEKQVVRQTDFSNRLSGLKDRLAQKDKKRSMKL